MTRAVRIVACLACVACAACGAELGNSPKRLRTALEASQDSLGGCYGKSLERAADAAGAMSLVIKVAGGQVTDVDITSSEIDDPKLSKCIKAAIKNVVLDPPSAADFDIEYTVKFRPGGDS